MGTEQRSRKNDSIDTTQDATTHYPDKKEIQKNENQDIETKEENGKVDITEMCSTDDESGDGQSTKTQDDVVSEVTFEDGPDEEMDTTRRGRMDRLHKEKHCRCIGQDGTCKDWMLEQDPQKNGNWH